MAKIQKEKGKYPYGIYSKLDIILGIFIFIFNVLISLGFGALFIFILHMNPYLSAVLFFIIFILLNIILGFIFFVLFSPIKLIKRRLYKTADFNKYIESMNKIIFNPKMHSESIKKLLIEESLVTLYFDLNNTTKIINKLEISKDSNHRLAYLECNTLISLEQNNYVKAKSYIDMIKKEFKDELELIDSLEYKYKFLSTKETINDIEEKLDIKTKSKYKNFINIHYLYLYYEKRNNKEKEEYYYSLLNEYLSKYQSLLKETLD